MGVREGRFRPFDVGSSTLDVRRFGVRRARLNHQKIERRTSNVQRLTSNESNSLLDRVFVRSYLPSRVFPPLIGADRLSAVFSGGEIVERGIGLADFDDPGFVQQDAEPVFLVPGAAELKADIGAAVPGKLQEVERAEAHVIL